MNNLYQCAILIILSTLCYWPSIYGTFTFDDKKAILQNEDVTNLTQSFFKIFKNDFWGQPIIDPQSHKSYRPFTILTFRLNYYLNELNAVSYHTTNIVLYTIVVLLVYKSMNNVIKPENKCANICFRATLLFAVHPIHVENVSSLVGRADLLSAIFFLIALNCYVENRLINYVIFSSLSILSKETGIAISAVCFFYNIIRRRPNLFEKQSHLVIFTALVLSIRLWIMNFTVPKFQKADNPAAFHPNFLVRIINYLYVDFMHGLLLFWPQWLCFDWSMGCVPLITQMTDLRIFPLVVSVISFLWIVKKLIRNCKNFKLQIGFIILVATFLPATNLFYTVGFVVAERILLLPSIGFCYVISHGFEILDLKHKWIMWSSICVIFFIRTRQRIYEWRNEETLFRSGLQVCPLNAKVHYNLAKVLNDSKNVTESEAHYRLALNLNPIYEQALNNLANILKNKREYNEAEKLLRLAVEIDPKFSAAWMNLGTVLKLTNRFYDSEQAYLKALKIRKGNYADCLYNLGNLYASNENSEKKAFPLWLDAVRINPRHMPSWNNLLIYLDKKRNTQKAIGLVQKALEYLPDSDQIHFHYANILGVIKNYDLSEKHYKKALSINSEIVIYYSNLGALYHSWRKYDKAKNYYEIAMLKDPKSQTIRKNYEKLLKVIK